MIYEPFHAGFSLYYTDFFNSIHVFFMKKTHTRNIREKKTRVYSRYDLSFKLQNVRARTQTQTIQFFSVWSLCLVSHIHTTTARVFVILPHLFVLLKIFRSKCFIHLLSRYLYTTPLLCSGLFNKKPQKCLRPNKQPNSPQQTARLWNHTTALFEVMSS